MGVLQVVGAITATHAPRITDGPRQPAVVTFEFVPQRARLARDQVRRPWCPLRRFVEVCGSLTLTLDAEDGRSVGSITQLCFRVAADDHGKRDIPVFLVADPTVPYPSNASTRNHLDSGPDDDALRTMSVFGMGWGPVLELHGRSAGLAYVWRSDEAVVPAVP